MSYNRVMSDIYHKLLKQRPPVAAKVDGGGGQLEVEEKSNSIDFVKQRRNTEAIVIGPDDEILFVSNGEGTTAKFLAGNIQSSEDHQARRQIRDLLHRVRRSVLSHGLMPEIQQARTRTSVVFSFRGLVIGLRGLLLNGTDGGEPLVMILIEQVKNEPRGSDAESHDYYFTPRENAVVNYIKKGFTNKEIAYSLSIGVHTVKDHIKRIMKKINVHTRCGIAGKLSER